MGERIVVSYETTTMLCCCIWWKGCWFSASLSIYIYMGSLGNYGCGRRLDFIFCFISLLGVIVHIYTVYDGQPHRYGAVYFVVRMIVNDPFYRYFGQLFISGWNILGPPLNMTSKLENMWTTHYHSATYHSLSLPSATTWDAQPHTYFFINFFIWACRWIFCDFFFFF